MLKKYGYIDLVQQQRIPLHDIPARKRRLRRIILVAFLSIGIVWFIIWFFSTLLNEYVSTTKWTPTWFFFVSSLTKGIPVIEPVAKVKYSYGMGDGWGWDCGVHYTSSAAPEKINNAVLKYIESRHFEKQGFSSEGGWVFHGKNGGIVFVNIVLQSDGSVSVSTYETP